MVDLGTRRRRVSLRHEAVKLFLILGLAQALEMITESLLLIIKFAPLFFEAGKLRALVVIEGGIAR